MIETPINTRIQNKHDIEDKWLAATNFIPKAGELIVYDVDNKYSYTRIKIGDGETTVNDLPFVYSIKTGGDINVDSFGNITVNDSSHNHSMTNIEGLQAKLEEISMTIIEPANNDIPKVFITGEMPTTKDDVIAEMTYISKTLKFHSYIKIKCQGTSSLRYPKKNFTIKLFEDKERTIKLKNNFRCWGEQNKFCLKANWIDISHARNIVSARIWSDIVKTRKNYNELPELLTTSPNQGAIDGFFIKVYYNGVYQGRYTWNIPKDAWMTNMDDSIDSHCILCGENYDSGCFRALPIIDESDWSDEIHDSCPNSIKARWTEVIDFVINSSDEEFKTNLDNYFDIPSLLDYHIFGIAMCGLDSYGKNQIYMTYDGNKWIASMYDMDSTWGLYWNGETLVSYDYARTSFEDMVNERQGNLLYERLEQNFYKELQDRWIELKNSALSLSNIINRFERFTDVISSDLIKEDYASTTANGNYVGIPSIARNNIQQIRNFAVLRRDWTDHYFNMLSPIERVPCTGITLSVTELVFTSRGTQTLIATVEPINTTDRIIWSTNDDSVATVKMVLLPLYLMEMQLLLQLVVNVMLHVLLQSVEFKILLFLMIQLYYIVYLL